MKLLLAGILALGSLCAFAEDEKISLPVACRIKCLEKLSDQYTNGIEEQEVITLADGRRYSTVNEIRIKRHFYAKQSNLTPGEYSAEDPRIGSVVAKPIVCGVYLTTFNNSGNFIERLIPDSLMFNSYKVLNGARFLENEYKIDDGQVNGYKVLGLYDKKPLFASRKELEQDMNLKVLQLKAEKICKR